MKERYGELDPHIRTFLEGLDADKVDTLKTLMGMDQTTIDWLKGARPEEIAKLSEGIKLVESIGTVSRGVKWLVIFFITSMAMAAALRDFIAQFFKWVGK